MKRNFVHIIVFAFAVVIIIIIIIIIITSSNQRLGVRSLPVIIVVCY